MFALRKVSLSLICLILVAITMLVAYILSTMVFGQTNISLTPEEAVRASQALPIVSLIYALVLSYPILHSRWTGIKLIGAVTIILFGVETFMGQMETFYYNNALQMGMMEFAAIVAAGALRAIIFAPFAVLIFGKVKKSKQSAEKQEALKFFE